MRLRLLVLALCAGLAGGGTAAAAPGCAGLPKHSRIPVVDAANVVPPEDEAWLAADLLRHHISGHEAIVAVTVPNLGGDDVSSYTKRLFDCWGVGDAQSDNGVLILVAMAERRVRIELGAGLEGRLTDAQLESALDQMVAPLRAGKVGAALRAAAVEVVRDLGGELPDTKANRPGTGTRPTTAPGDVQDTSGDGNALPIDDLPIAIEPGGPFGPSDGGASGLATLVPVLFVIGIVVSVVRAVIRGAGFGSFGGSTWRGGFPHHGAGWDSASLLRGGAWHRSGSPSPGFDDGGWSGGSSFGSSGGSSGSSGGSDSSFGGGSSGGGGASGSW